MKNLERYIEGVFKHVLYSPHGSIEGAIIETEGSPAQLVVQKHDEATGEYLAALREGQQIVVDAALQGPSDKGVAEHPVFALARVVSVDGTKPSKSKPRIRQAAYNGKVVRFNFARHGEKNGVFLDSGDFIHLKPEGMTKCRLSLGDQVAADGDAWPMLTGAGYVVEASSVNGKAVFRRPKD